MKKEAFIASLATLSMLTGFATEAPVVDGRIVIEDAGTYTLSSDTTVSGVVFKTDGAVIDGDATLTLTTPAEILGSGSILAPMAGTDGISITNVFAEVETIPQRTEPTLLWTSPDQPPEFDKIHAHIGGYWVLQNSTFKAALRAFPVAYTQVSDTEAVVQYHLIRTPRAVGFKVRFTYSGGCVYCQVIWAKYVDKAYKEYYYDDWDNIPSNKLGTYNPATFNLGEICLCRLGTEQSVTIGGTLPGGTIAAYGTDVTIAPDSAITFTNKITGAFKSFTFKGKRTESDGTVMIDFPVTASRNTYAGDMIFDSIGVTVQDQYLLPKGGTLVLTNSSSFTFNGKYKGGEAGQLFNSAWSAPCYCYVRSGCDFTIDSGADWIVGHNTYFFIDGGALEVNSPEYILFMTLMNGAVVRGSKFFNAGYTYAETYTHIEGDVPCTIQIPIRNWDQNGANVHTFDTKADLNMQGGICLYTDNYETMTWLKTGPATMYVSGKSATYSAAKGIVKIEEGAVALNCNDAFSRTNNVVLSGGALDEGAFTNRLGTLSVTTNSTLVAGSGSLTFSDSSSVAWTAGATLSVTGAADSLKSGHIRFLGAGLTDAQLSAMRYNGSLRLRMDGDGWLRSYQPGMEILFK